MASELELLTEEEVSKIFKVKKSTINTWYGRDMIPEGIVLKMGTGKKGTKRFIKSKLEEWILNGCLQEA